MKTVIVSNRVAIAGMVAAIALLVNVGESQAAAFPGSGADEVPCSATYDCGANPLPNQNCTLVSQPKCAPVAGYSESYCSAAEVGYNSGSPPAPGKHTIDGVCEPFV